MHADPRLALVLSGLLGRVAGETLLTRDELAALTAGLLASSEPPAGTRRFMDWLAGSAGSLGTSFASDLRRPWPAS